MPRRNFSRRAPERSARGDLGWAKRESGADGEWMVRAVPGERTTKSYRCPGCDHEIRPGTAHVVTWPVEEPADRRHWHAACWTARGRRAPTRRRR